MLYEVITVANRSLTAANPPRKGNEVPTMIIFMGD